MSRLISIICAALVGVYAWADVPRQIDVPAGDLVAALELISKQAEVELVFQPEQLKGLRTKGVSGLLSSQEAVKKLLEGTQLQLRTDASTGAMMIGEASPPPAAAIAQSPSAIRLAQAQTEESKGDEPTLEEVVVTGTHIRGTRNDTAPVIVLDRAYIDSTGISTTAGLIESLPQNFALASQSGISVPGVSDGPTTQGASINLRGVGEGTTLTLINGRRMALGFIGRSADISALPLSAIERVEILTDGASALYGSDAVGGVVNFILRRDFDGAETRLRSGWADGGVNEYRASQALGNSWGSGNVLASVEYYKRDLLLGSERDFVPATSDIGSLFPQDETFSALVTGRQSLTDSLSVFTDTLYTNRDSFNEAGRLTFNKNTRIDNPQLAVTAGLDWRAASDWQVELAASYARNKMNSLSSAIPDDPSLPSPYAPLFRFDTRFAIESLQLKADGSLFALPSGKVRAAVGVDWREESLASVSSPSAKPPFDEQQTVRSVFAEVHVPLVEERALRAARRLELSVAGRYDEYSNFGSSFDPRFGLMWEPLEGLRLRGSYGTSYVAPKLPDYDVANNFGVAFYFPAPGFTGDAHILNITGNARETYAAQESKSWSFGVELAPAAVKNLEVGLNYYRIEYSDSIGDVPDFFTLLNNQASFPDLAIRNPPVGQVNEYVAIGELGDPFIGLTPDGQLDTNFDPSTINLILDQRRRNLASVKTSGIDLTFQYGFEAGGSSLQLGIDSTYILEREKQVDPLSAPFETLDTIYNPVAWRVQGSLGLRRGAIASNLFVNHTDSYTDSRSIPSTPIGSYTTVNARVAYDFKEHLESGFFSGVVLAASAQNLLDRDPPRTAVLFNLSDMGFDPTNTNPMGRLLAIELTKSW